MMNAIMNGKYNMEIVIALLAAVCVWYFLARPAPAPPGADVLPGEKTIVYFHMTGCGHCVKFNPIWTEFVKTTPIKTAKVESKDIANSPYAHLSASIGGFPTILLLVNGQVAAELQDRSLIGLNGLDK